VCAIQARSHFGIRRRRDAQKMQELGIVMSQKSFTDVVHHRHARPIHLFGDGRLPPEFRPSYEFSDAVALLLCGLPNPEVLEAVHGHAFE
jgi:hypothetical protein